MSGHDHGHDAHGLAEHGDHGSHGGAHAEHGHGHEEHWGDYNAEKPGSNPLPPIHPALLAVYGFALAALLGAIVNFSFQLAGAKHGDAAHEDGGHSDGHSHDHEHGKAEEKHH